MTQDKLSEILDITPLPSTTETTEVVAQHESANTTVSDDSSYAQDNIRTLIETGLPTLQNLIRIANDSQHPRAYEVVTQLLKTISDLNKDLMDIHKKEADITKASPADAATAASVAWHNASSPIHVKNAVFVGTTKDLKTHLNES